MTAEKQMKTFLSYSRLNKDFAVKLANELKSEGFNVWLDTLDIPLGSRWDREVERALKESEIFMIILTPNSVDSENVLDEIGYAIDTHKRILPILLEDCEVPLRLRRLQYIDFTHKSFDEGVDAAKTLLRGLIAQHTIPREAIQPDVQAKSNRKAKEKADRLAKAEVKRKAKEETDQIAKAEADRKAKEEADRLEKAEADRRTKEQAERLAKAEADRKAKEEADKRAKAEADRRAKEEVDRKANEKVEREPKPERKSEPVPSSTQQKKPLSRGLLAGIITFVVLCVAGVGLAINAFSKRDTQASNVQDILPSATNQNSVSTPKPTNTQRPTSTPRPSPTLIPEPLVLNSSDAAKILDAGDWKGIFATAREQHTDDEINGFFDDSQPIPVMLTEYGPIVVGYSGICAKTEDILTENLKYTKLRIIFNKAVISENKIVKEYYNSEDGWECTNLRIVIDGWTTGEYTLYHEILVTKTLNDGESDYGPYTTGVNYIITVP